MNKLVFIVFLLASFGAYGQVPEPAMLWLKGYGGNGGSSIEPSVTKTGDGGFIVNLSSNAVAGTGNIDSFCHTTGNTSIFLKYNADGTILEWSRCFGAGGDTNIVYIFPTRDNGFVLGGDFGSGDGYGFYICKQDAIGNILWSRSYSKGSDPLLRDMIATSDGGYIMLGELYYTDTNFVTHYGGLSEDIGVLKLDSNGNKIWAKVIGGTGRDLPGKVIDIPGVGCYVLAATSSNNFDCTGNHGGYDGYLVRMDNNGNIVWHRDFGGTGGDGGGGITNGYACYNGKGGIIIATIAGSADGDVSHMINPGGENIWVLEIDSNNHIIWDNCYGGGGYEIPNSVCKSTDGSIWIIGYVENKGGQVDTAFGRGDAWVAHIDSVGSFLNAKVMGSSRQDDGYMIYPLSNGNVIAGGYYDTAGGTMPNVFYGTFGGSDDAFLTVFDPRNQTEVGQLASNNIEPLIYPNPTNYIININIPYSEETKIIIEDVLGRVIYSRSFFQNLQIDANNWSRGIYYLKVIAKDGRVNTQTLFLR